MRSTCIEVYRNISDVTDVGGLRTTIRTTGLRPKKSVLVLILQVWCCVVKHGLVTLTQQLFKYYTQSHKQTQTDRDD